MNVFKVVFKISYPDCVSERESHYAYVMAENFNEAEAKICQRYKKEFESAHVNLIELLSDNFSIVI